MVDAVGSISFAVVVGCNTEFVVVFDVVSDKFDSSKTCEVLEGNELGMSDAHVDSSVSVIDFSSVSELIVGVTLVVLLVYLSSFVVWKWE